jgi:tRNA 5-methylaminomethyl-2-thiouridine biosynthesis bifunctional protein
MKGRPGKAEPASRRPKRNEAAGLAHARQCFLAGCDLPAAWAGQPRWRILETGFGLGLNFLVTWQAWRDDPNRPQLLHFVSTLGSVASKADLLLAASAHPPLTPLANELGAQWSGLLPGTHRLAFEDGRVLLTLGVGDARTWLKAQHLCVDSVYLDSLDNWDAHTLKAVARVCQKGTRLSSRAITRGMMNGLQQCGFRVIEEPAVSAPNDNLQAVFNPPWEHRRKTEAAWPQPQRAQRCLVIGAGLAGAAAAASLARRGWVVTVLDANQSPAGGASSLPVGFLAPHVSPDDSVLSRLSRSGLRAAWQTVAALLAPGDWQACGVLQRRGDASARLPEDWPEAGAHWSQEAGANRLQNGEFESDAQRPLWHAAGGWVKPARLTEALLNTSGVTWRCGQEVTCLARLGTENAAVWQALDKAGVSIAEAELVVVAAGPASAGLVASFCGQAPPLQGVRGQVLWGRWPTADTKSDAGECSDLASALPASPINGWGGLIPMFPLSGQGGLQQHWLVGATFERGECQPLVRPEDTQRLQDQLARLWPKAAEALKPQIATGKAQNWAGVRCASPDRLPMVGPLDESTAPGLWLCTAMGSRGLTFAVLCGELLAAWANDEPLPLEKRLAQHLLASRFKQA